MMKSLRFAEGLLLSVLALAGVAINPAFAQDKGKDAKAASAAKAEKGKPTVKILVDNAKVSVREIRYRPGDVQTGDRSSFRVIRTLQGGTIERAYPDGRKAVIELKTGTVVYAEPAKGAGEIYTNKNIGKTDIVNYVVQLK